jgi:16S rRNA (cytosine967-C5)-methyltransferase
LVQSWLDQLGENETRALLAVNNTAAPKVLRCLVEREQALAELSARGIEAEAARYAPDAVIAHNIGDWSGIAVPQGEASQLVVLYLNPLPGQLVLDACAAPGGKTAYAARMVGEGQPVGSGRVVAVDPARGGESRVARTVAACGVNNVEFHACSLQELQTGDDFDAVLVDVPCSGLGTLRQNPEIRWRRQPSDLTDLASRQGELLQLASGRVAPGGVLLYSTCTLVEAENDAVVDSFLAENPDFTEPGANEQATACLRPLLDSRGRLRTFPHLHGCDGFFAARLCRR